MQATSSQIKPSMFHLDLVAYIKKVRGQLLVLSCQLHEFYPWDELCNNIILLSTYIPFLHLTLLTLFSESDWIKIQQSVQQLTC